MKWNKIELNSNKIYIFYFYFILHFIFFSLRHTALEDRKTMIIDSVFAHKSKEYIDNLR
jgi:hypothetical protein